VTDLLQSRWKGQPHRLEVWYATLTETATGTGAWMHHELVARPDGSAVVHGWTALFPVDEEPLLERYGPEPVRVGDDPGVPKAMAAATGDRPLYTFPRWAWEREVLPGAQVVAVPNGRFSGTLEVGGRSLDLDGCTGNVARIYGHGNAQRWGWLHADLGDGDVLEVVAGVPRRRGLNRLPPMPLVQLRLGGRDWPREPLAAMPVFRARLGLPRWSVRGTVGRRRLRVEVDIPEERAVAVAYADPDGAPATCTNSERADAEIVLERWRSGWETERRWSLRGTAHAEIGTRP
jgi:hypothetical protein